jgi:hypothetical protein
LLCLLKARRSFALGATVRRTGDINLLLFAFEVFILRPGESVTVSPFTSWLLESRQLLLVVDLRAEASHFSAVVRLLMHRVSIMVVKSHCLLVIFLSR